MKTLALLCLATSAAFASPVVYTFTATARPSMGSPAHTQTFQMVAPDFVPVVDGGPLVSFRADDPTLAFCAPCTAPPATALHFLRSGSSDLLQFVDQNGTNYLFDFPTGTFSAFGTWQTKPGINVNRGALTVAATPEPSTVALGFIGLALVAACHRRRAAEELKPPTSFVA